jgi:hypothetical protein
MEQKSVDEGVELVDVQHFFVRTGWLKIVLALTMGAPAVAAPATPSDQSQVIAPVETLEPVLVSHTAVYDVALIRATQTEGVRGASGRLTYTFRDRCDGYTIETELDANLAYSSGLTNHVIQRYAGWESKDGLRSTFRMSVYDNDELEDAYTGSVELNADGSGRAYYRGDEAVTYELPPGTVLSTRQLKGLIRSGRDNAALVAEPVMDGSFDQGPYRATGFISPMRSVGAESLEALVSTANPDDRALLQGGYWPITLAYFPLLGATETPDYELSLQLQSNGIVRFMAQDFVTYTLSFELAAVRALPGGCG